MCFCFSTYAVIFCCTHVFSEQGTRKSLQADKLERPGLSLFPGTPGAPCMPPRWRRVPFGGDPLRPGTFFYC